MLSMVGRRSSLAAIGLGCGALASAILVVAHADGAPKQQPLWYTGTVTDDAGAPLGGNHSIAVRIFRDETGLGAAVCEVSTGGQRTLPFVAGRFRIDLSDCARAIADDSELFLELQIDNLVPFPRTKLGAVPYALEAEHAITATKADTASFADHTTSADTAANATEARGDFNVAGTASAGALNVRGDLMVSGSISFGIHAATDAACSYQDMGFYVCQCDPGEIAISGGVWCRPKDGMPDVWGTIHESRNQGVSTGGPMNGAWILVCNQPNMERFPGQTPFAVCARITPSS
jgi:hypothetical protein